MIRWCHKVREMTRKQKRVLSGRAGSVKTGMPSKKHQARASQVEHPLPQHPSRCLAPQVFALTQRLCKPAGLGPQSQADAEKRGWTAGNRHWVHSSQGVGSTHPVHRTGTKNLRKANHRLTNSMPACTGTQCTVHTPGSTIFIEDTVGSTRRPAPKLRVIG